MDAERVDCKVTARESGRGVVKGKGTWVEGTLTDEEKIALARLVLEASVSGVVVEPRKVESKPEGPSDE